MMHSPKSNHKLKPSFKFGAIGTSWQIDIHDDISEEEGNLIFEKIQKRIDAFDQHYSRFREDSLVMKMAQPKDDVSARSYEMPEDFSLMWQLYEKLERITEGKMTPLIGQVLIDAGYDAEYSLVQKKDLEVPPRRSEVAELDGNKLILKKPLLLDFGAIGKGYLIDIVSEILEIEGILSYCVEAGGDMRYRNSAGEKMKVGLENPLNFQEVIGVIDILDQSLCGSSGSRRKWGKFHHIINSQTLSSPSDILSVWVLADTTRLADALTTALFFVSPEVLKKEYNFEYLILHSDFSISRSSEFNAKLYENNR